MREIVDSIENGIKELFESDKYRKYLATMSRFHRYSVNNTMLIYMQRPRRHPCGGLQQVARSVRQERPERRKRYPHHRSYSL